MKRLSNRHQRTIGRPIEVLGVGFLSGATVRLSFEPAPPNSGIAFLRTDLKLSQPIPARVEQVTGTNRRTTLGKSPNAVGLVEHVLAALAGLRIDNCLIRLNAPEPPGLDGSAQRFVESLRQAGTVLQPAPRTAWTVDQPILLQQNGATLSLYPDETELKISYLLDFGPRSPIGRQICTASITPEHFVNRVACCRTFILESEAAELRAQGLGTRTTNADLLVFGRRGPIDNRLRYADEPARHKILDLVGDLSLCGHDLCGHVVAYRSGHPLNVRMAEILSQRLTGLRLSNVMAA